MSKNERQDNRLPMTWYHFVTSEGTEVIKFVAAGNESAWEHVHKRVPSETISGGKLLDAEGTEVR